MIKTTLDAVKDGDILNFFSKNCDCSLFKVLDIIDVKDDDSCIKKMVRFIRPDNSMFNVMLSDFGFWTDGANAVPFPKIIQDNYREFLREYNQKNTDENSKNFAYKMAKDFFRDYFK